MCWLNAAFTPVGIWTGRFWSVHSVVCGRSVVDELIPLFLDGSLASHQADCNAVALLALLAMPCKRRRKSAGETFGDFCEIASCDIFLFRRFGDAFTARCYAERGIAIPYCPSVRLSVTLRYRGHIGYSSWEIISRLINLIFPLSADPKITDLLQRNIPKFYPE